MKRNEGFIKTLIAMIVAFVVVLGSTNFAFAGTSVPTQEWDLSILGGYGVSTDWENHWGNYPFSAYVNCNKIYSNYYFTHASNQSLSIWGWMSGATNTWRLIVQSRTVNNSQGTFARYQGKSQTSYSYNGNTYPMNGYSFGTSSYFSADGLDYNAEVSVYGQYSEMGN